MPNKTRVYKRPLPNSTQRLLDAIYQHNGGITKTAEMIGEATQNLNLWRRAGAVPLKHVGWVAFKLRVPECALNYEEVIKLNNITPDWQRLVTRCKLSAFLENYVLAGKRPEKAETILEYLNGDRKVTESSPVLTGTESGRGERP